MRYMSILLLTLLLGTSLAIQTSNGKDTATATANKEASTNDKDKHDSSSSASVPTSNTGYRYNGPAQHYLPPTAQSAPLPAPNHQHQEEGYKYQAPVVNHAASFSLGGSALYQHSSQTPALAVNLEHASAEKLPEHAPSYYVPKGESVAKKPDYAGGYYTPSYFVHRPTTQVVQSQTEEVHNEGYEYARPSDTNFAGYQYKGQELAQHIVPNGFSSSDTNNGYHYQKVETPFANQAYNKIPSYAKPTLALQIPSPVESFKPNGNDYRFNYPGSSSEATQTKNEFFSGGYHHQSPAFESSQPKDESFTNHKQPFTSSNNIPTSKPIFEAANDNGILSDFGYKQEQPHFAAESLNSNTFGQNSYPGSSYFNKLVESNSNTFVPGPNYSPYPQQPHTSSYAAPTQIPSQTSHPLASLSHNFPAHPASTFDLPHPGPISSFAAQTPAVPSPTYLPASAQHGTPSTQHFASGNEELGAYYSHALNKPMENNPLDYKRPSSQLLPGGERYPQESYSSANDLDYLQMQSQSYQLPSYYTMQMEVPTDLRQQQFEQPQPHEVSYQLSNPQGLNSYSYGAPVHQPHAAYGAPIVEATQATPAQAYLPPSGQFQPPYFIK